MRTRWLAIACLLGTIPTQVSWAQEPLQRIGFGSCMSQEKPQPFWEPILAQKPDLFLFLGDNIYGDTDNIDVLKAKYGQLAAIPGFQRLRQAVPHMATWDDHDYGVDDGGADFPIKDASQKLFCDFWNDPADSPRRSRPGVYEAKLFGPVGKRVQVVMLDTRYFRSPLVKAVGRGRYSASDDPAKSMLGDAQWQWLAEQLRTPAELRLLVSSIQVVAEEHPFEKWANLPRERERLLATIRGSGANGVLLLSGGRHLAELSVADKLVGYPLYDFTSSGLNMASAKWRLPEANKHRVAVMSQGNNFGMVRVDWATGEVTLEARDDAGALAFSHRVPLSALQGHGQPIAAQPAAPPKSDSPVSANGTIKPEDALKHLGQKVVIQMTVAATGQTRDKSRTFLNSSADFRAKDNLTVVVPARGVGEQFKARGVTDVAAHFKGKHIRVSGTVSEFQDKAQVMVDSVEQLKIVE